MTARCVCGCRGRVVNQHHVVYRQEIVRRGGDVRDPRNLVPVAWTCHADHHGRGGPLPLRVLPDSAYEYAGELMGPAAFDWLQRHYAGTDDRLDALLTVPGA